MPVPPSLTRFASSFGRASSLPSLTRVARGFGQASRRPSLTRIATSFGGASRRVFGSIVLLTALGGPGDDGAGDDTVWRLHAPAVVAQEQGPTARPFSITARRYTFNPPRLEVFQDDVVKIELRTEDIAHSWTVDAYRLAKRVGPGQPVSFEFRADQPGTFRFYCNLQIDDRCRGMHGALVVKPRK